MGQLESIDKLLVKMLEKDKKLGKLNREQIAKLMGVAPMNRDSGNTMGKRFIMGGRGNVRAILYMATLVAIRHNEKIRACYAHLKSHRKESKVVSPQSPRGA